MVHSYWLNARLYLYFTSFSATVPLLFQVPIQDTPFPLVSISPYSPLAYDNFQCFCCVLNDLDRFKYCLGLMEKVSFSHDYTEIERFGEECYTSEVFPWHHTWGTWHLPNIPAGQLCHWLKVPFFLFLYSILWKPVTIWPVQTFKSCGRPTSKMTPEVPTS